MKRLLFAVILSLLVPFIAKGQSHNTSSVTGYQVQCYGIIQTYPTIDTLEWYIDRAEIIALINAGGTANTQVQTNLVDTAAIHLTKINQVQTNLADTAAARGTTAQTNLADSITLVKGNYLFGKVALVGNGTQDTFHVTVPSGFLFAVCSFDSGATAGTDSLASYGCKLSGTLLLITFYDKPGKSIPPLSNFQMTYFLGKQ